MKKILLAFDGTHFSEGAFEFVRRLNEQQPVLVTGTFLPQLDFASSWRFTDPFSGIYISPVAEEEPPVINNLDWFKEQCEKNKIPYCIHDDYDMITYAALKKEMKYADLLILSSEKFYEYLGTGISNPTLKDTLHDAGCPVIIIPEKFEYPDTLIIAYDGSDDAVYAIKQFAYLLPELCKKTATLVYEENNENRIPDETYIKELASCYFPNLSILKIKGDPANFKDWLTKKEHSLLISGSFGRSSLSQLFKKSFIADIVDQHKLPVFIAHK